MSTIELNGYEYYYEVVGAGPPIILAHPFMSTIFHWHKSGWVDELKENNTLIMFEYPGHGRSSSPKEIEHYYVNNISNLVINIVDFLNIKNFIMFGFSMGGRVCFDLIRDHSERMSALIVGGMHAKPPANHKRIISYKDEDLDVKIRQKFDLSSLKLCSKAQEEWGGCEEKLSKFNNPALLFAGKEDPYYNWIKSSAELFNNKLFYEYEGLGHIGAFWRLNRVSGHIKKFIEDINNKNT